ncbi:restriction endonuclease subunit S [Empedobacter sp. ULE_I145]
MSKLDELLQGVKVEWLPLKEIAELQRGKTITAKNKTEGNIPVISGGQKPAYYNGEFNRTDETITIAGSGAYAGYISYWNEPIFVSDAFSIKPDLSIVNIKYAYYFLLTKQEWIYSLKKGAGIPHVYPKDLEKLQIPIPFPYNPEKSLEIQQEIVRVLDELTTLTNQLTTELETERQNRKKQFEFFREQLFTFEEDENNYVALGELAENLDSKRKPITSSQRKPGKIPYYGASGIVDYVEDYIFDGDYLLISEDGANLLARSTPIAFSISGKNWVNNHAHILKFETKYERLFVEYYLNSIDLAPYITGAAQPKLNKKNLNSIKIPNPALEEKERIVKLLDQFDATHTAIEEEITKEIKLRTQQYEYYREKLLSFPSLRTT